MSSKTTVERQLVALAEELEALQVRQEQAYGRRLALWLEGRTLGMTQHDLAVPSRVTEGAVTQALRKHRLRNGSHT